MPRPAEPGRSALLRAGAEVATERGLKGLSVNAVVDAAGMAKGSFYHHFPDRRSYVIALHREYHDAIDAAVSSRSTVANQAKGACAPGSSRTSTLADAPAPPRRSWPSPAPTPTSSTR